MASSLGTRLLLTSIPFRTGTVPILLVSLCYTNWHKGVYGTQRYLLQYNSPLLAVSEIHHSCSDSSEEIDGTLEDDSEKNILKKNLHFRF